MGPEERWTSRVSVENLTRTVSLPKNWDKVH